MGQKPLELVGENLKPALSTEGRERAQREGQATPGGRWQGEYGKGLTGELVLGAAAGQADLRRVCRVLKV